MPLSKGLVVFSGGSAANNLVDVFEAVRKSKDCSLSYIIPISDNGGSSSELIRFFAGPGIGDVRSRLVRLIPNNRTSLEDMAISALFNHRLSSSSSYYAAQEWQDIVAGTSVLWNAVSPAKKELIRSFLNQINLEIIKRSRPPTSTFDFTSASIGNLFLTGARLFSGSFESGIYLLSSLCGIPDDLVKVIPSINSSFSHHIAAGLENGEVIVGQNSISHPSIPTALESARPYSPSDTRARRNLDHSYQDEDAHLPGTLPTLRSRNIKFSKEQDEDLSARIERIWYINPYGQEMFPQANPRVIEAIEESQAVIYSIGSLYTSIVPSLILRGVGESLRTSSARHKILILNGSLDREVGPSHHPYNALDFVYAITRAGEASRGVIWHPPTRQRPSLRTSRSEVSLSQSHSKSAPPTSPRSTNNTQHPLPTLSPYPSTSAADDTEASTPRKYVTHLIYLAGDGTPYVDRDAFASLGINCLKVYGRKIGATANLEQPNGSERKTKGEAEQLNGTEYEPQGEPQNPTTMVRKAGMCYDPHALIGAIEAILGKKGDAMIMGGAKSRRNTLDA